MNEQNIQPLDDALEALNFTAVLNVVADRASTEYGVARVRKLRPVKGVIDLDREFDRIEALTGLLQRGDSLPFGGVRDLDDALKRAELPGTHLEPDRLLDVMQTVVSARKLRTFIEKRRDSLGPLTVYSEAIEEMPRLETEIARTIDSGSGEVKDNASPELKRLRGAIASLTRKTRNRLDAMIRKYSSDGWLLDSGYSIRDGRFVLAVKQTYRGRVRGIVHDLSASGGTAFIEPDELVVLGNEMRELAEEEGEEVRRILVELTDLVREHKDALRAAVDAIGLLDSLQARADFAQEVGAMRPRVKAGSLRLVAARHPLLLLRKGLDTTVPLDLELEDEREVGESGRILVITGPNAGGKTVALKTIGLTTALIHAGIWPPCGDGTVVPPLEEWHVIIGDDQSLEGDLSSFSGHLEKLKQVTDDPGLRKLVLVDEIASGTDPGEGGALAMAFLEQAVSHGWWTVVTTHMGTLKTYAHRREGVRNGSMQFDRKKLTPTYRFVPDIPGSSYALEIAQRVGLPREMVDAARDLAGEEKMRLEDLIEELSTRLHNVHMRERELVLQKSETAALEKVLRERLEKIEQKRAELTGKAAAEAKGLLAEANRAIERAVKEIREQQASREAIRVAHEQVKAQKERVERAGREAEKKREKNGKSSGKRDSRGRKTIRSSEPAALPDEELGGPLQVGDEVRLESGMRGEVLALKGERAQVVAGAVKVWMPVSDLKKVHRQQPGKAGRINLHLEQPEQGEPVRTELQLLGMRYEQAANALDKYLEDLALSGLKVARIVHGKGTGALRAMVVEKLTGNPMVRTFRFGDPREGGDGVTIVELDD